ncbi:16S rRNA (guanine(1207)-N(2))-methyltransferase RsmC [Vibrio mediterranei]|uniref:Ribosomal RNA small subunit methyltransferase C n=1 Tax=Vibrio mediterranei TaxID=689 RepID=A0A3G4V8D7_9VIBR|nr:16S rRNA (guanine(1207)-N(2))-methyltransferase RsmC [Vibrio mediterranei]AYV20970.1 16S rRNA (guanine(1207)-N(2))-methyltransferase RsmC [Vibrio mediterranei]NUW73609.1 16S rRNA (guanine(1207)-N(2))-methyltransferase RsmC [Vibrio mediterranei]
MATYIAPSQIAERQLEYFAQKRVLVIGEIEDQFPIELSKHCDKVTVFTSNYITYRMLSSSSKITTLFGASLSSDIDADMILLYWPKAKAEAQMLLEMALAKLGNDTEIAVVGENRSGVKSIEKMFKPYGPMNKYDSARRCSFYWGMCQSAPESFELKNWFKSYQVELNGLPITVKSLPGVFSHGEFDSGSQLLLNNLPELKGKVLDFGCGAGVIGAYMGLKYNDIELNMCDINAFAIESSKQTLLANNLEGQVFASDVYSDVTPGLDFIISNPPFHAGLDTSYSATETLLSDAPNYMNSKGQLMIVANSFLKYPPIIEQQFGHCHTVDKNRKFAIYHATK